MAKSKKFKILILFYSFSGHTEKLVKYIQEGAESLPHTEVVAKRIPELLKDDFFDKNPKFKKTKEQLEKKYEEATLDDLIEADGVIIGSPVRFGQASAQVKQFIDGLSPIYVNNQLINKPFAVFTSGGSQDGGTEMTLMSLMIPFIWLGMIPVGIPYPLREVSKNFDAGCPLGVTFASGTHGQNKITNQHKKIARVLGARLAMMVDMMNCGCSITREAMDKFKKI